MGFCLKTSKNHGFANWFPLTFMAAVLSSRYKPCWLRDVLASKTHRFCSWPAWKRDNAAISQIHLGFPRPRFGDLVVWNMFIFPYIENHNPNWRTHIFQKGRSTTSLLILGSMILEKIYQLGSNNESQLMGVFASVHLVMYFDVGNLWEMLLMLNCHFIAILYYISNILHFWTRPCLQKGHNSLLVL